MNRCLVHKDCKWPLEGRNYSDEYHTKTTFVGIDKLMERIIELTGSVGRREYIESRLIDATKNCGFNKPVIYRSWHEKRVYFFELSKVDHWEIDDEGNHIQLWEQVLTWEGKELAPRDRAEYELELRNEYDRKRAIEQRQFNRGWPEDKQKKAPVKGLG